MRVESHAKGMAQLANALNKVVGKIHGFEPTHAENGSNDPAPQARGEFAAFERNEMPAWKLAPGGRPIGARSAVEAPRRRKGPNPFPAPGLPGKGIFAMYLGSGLPTDKVSDKMAFSRFGG